MGQTRRIYFSLTPLSSMFRKYGYVLSFKQEILRHFAPQNDNTCHSERSEESQYHDSKYVTVIMN